MCTCCCCTCQQTTIECMDEMYCCVLLLLLMITFETNELKQKKEEEEFWSREIQILISHLYAAISSKLFVQFDDEIEKRKQTNKQTLNKDSSKQTTILSIATFGFNFVAR